jgi:hypothetical protein
LRFCSTPTLSPRCHVVDTPPHSSCHVPCRSLTPHILQALGWAEAAVTPPPRCGPQISWSANLPQMTSCCTGLERLAPTFLSSSGGLR